MVRQVGYLQELYRDAPSTEYLNYLRDFLVFYVKALKSRIILITCKHVFHASEGRNNSL